jgi:hypothetical protein
MTKKEFFKELDLFVKILPDMRKKETLILIVEPEKTIYVNQNIINFLIQDHHGAQRLIYKYTTYKKEKAEAMIKKLNKWLKDWKKKNDNP